MTKAPTNEPESAPCWTNNVFRLWSIFCVPVLFFLFLICKHASCWWLNTSLKLLIEYFHFIFFLTATQLKFQNTDIFNFLLHFIYLIHTSRITILQTKHANLIKSWIVDGLNHPKLGEYLNFWLPHTTKSPFIHITAWTIVIQYNNMTLPV